MFNAEKLLGGLLQNGARSKGNSGSLVSGGVGLGLDDSAIAAIKEAVGL